jgi:hypothetical protein
MLNKNLKELVTCKHDELFITSHNHSTYYFKDCDVTALSDWYAYSKGNEHPRKTTVPIRTDQAQGSASHERDSQSMPKDQKKTTRPMRRMLNTSNEGIASATQQAEHVAKPNLPQEHNKAIQSKAHKDTTSSEMQSSRATNKKTQEQNIVFIGPSSSGKTAILCSLKQAVEHLDEQRTYQLNRDDDSLSFYIDESEEGKTLKQLLRSFQHGIIHKHKEVMQPTDHANYFRFQINTRKGKSFTCSALDGKGGSLFADNEKEYEARKNSGQGKLVLEEAAKASTIILCIDANKIMQEYHQQLVQTIIADIIAAQNALSAEANQEETPLLIVTNFIILLTKVDCLAERACEEIRLEQNNQTTVRPRSIVDFIDPVEQARESIGKQGLESILNKLIAGAKLYIGMSSAWGFDPYGYPIAAQNGSFRYWVDTSNPYDIRPIDHDITDEEYQNAPHCYTERRTFDDWQPYGLQDLIFFLMDKEQSGRFLEVNKDTIKRAGPRNTEMFPEPLTQNRRKS